MKALAWVVTVIAVGFLLAVILGTAAVLTALAVVLLSREADLPAHPPVPTPAPVQTLGLTVPAIRKTATGHQAPVIPANPQGAPWPALFRIQCRT